MVQEIWEIKGLRESAPLGHFYFCKQKYVAPAKGFSVQDCTETIITLNKCEPTRTRTWNYGFGDRRFTIETISPYI